MQLWPFFGASDSEAELAREPEVQSASGDLGIDSSDSSTGTELTEDDTPHAKTGRPCSSLLDRLTRPVTAPTKGRMKRYRCAGEKCPWTCSGRAAGRVLRHASQCLFLTTALRETACRASANDAPGSRLARLEAAHSDHTQTSCPDSEVDHGPPAQSSSQVTATIAKPRRQHEQIRLDFGEAGRALLTAKLHHVIVRFICVHGIPPSVVDSVEWKEMWAVGNMRYRPVSASTLEETHIPQEAERVHQLTLAYLKTQTNLTISYDGGSNRRRESYYTIHIITSPSVMSAPVLPLAHPSSPPAHPTPPAPPSNVKTSGCKAFLYKCAAGTGYAHTGQRIEKRMEHVRSLH